MLKQAKLFAEKAHEGQVRKNGSKPYVTHPIRVAKLLKQAGMSDELVAAGYLHDTVEDTAVELNDIEEIFGPKVTALVASHTEDKSKSWQERKQHTIDTVKLADKEVKYLIVADKLDNLLSIEKDLEEIGGKMWESFNAGPEQQKWYYESVVDVMYTGLAKDEIPAFFKQYEEAVQRVFGGKA